MQKFRKISLLLNASRVRAFPLSAAVILSALCSPAWAEQETVKIGAVVSAEPDTGYSFTHSGTALGVTIPLEDTPQSVLTIKIQVLEDQLATTLWDGLKNVSGVFSRGTNSAVSEDFVIRGFRLDPRRNYYHRISPSSATASAKRPVGACICRTWWNSATNGFCWGACAMTGSISTNVRTSAVPTEPTTAVTAV